jgi:hypothetical protein
MSYPNFDQGGNSSQTTLAGSTAADAAALRVPSATPRYSDDQNFRDVDGDNELPDGPPATEGPAVANLSPLVNPSAGLTGSAGGGSTSVGGQGDGAIPDRGPHSDVQSPANPQQSGTGYTR